MNMNKSILSFTLSSILLSMILVLSLLSMKSNYYHSNNLHNNNGSNYYSQQSQSLEQSSWLKKRTLYPYPFQVTLAPIETRSRKPIPILRYSDHVCGVGEWKCMNGLCILDHWKCDNYDDCGDWSDEYNCPAYPISNLSNETETNLIKNGQQVDNSGQKKKSENSSSGFQKRFGRGEEDKKQTMSIERGSKRGCPEGRFDCGNNGQCITKEFICDSESDCSNDRDELNCPRPFGTLKPLKSSAGQASGTQKKVSPLYVHPFPLPPSSALAAGVLLDTKPKGVKGGHLVDNNRPLYQSSISSSGRPVTCKEGTEFKCVPNNGDRNSITGNVNGHNASVFDPGQHSHDMEPRDGTSINEGEACFPLTSLCNGIIDCADGSDESDCTGNDVFCGLDAFTCSNYQCIKADQVCDRHKDCLDGSDESGCVYCNKQNQFECKSSKETGFKVYKCIPKHYLCDSFKDCDDASDETLDECPVSVFKPAIKKVANKTSSASPSASPNATSLDQNQDKSIIRTTLINSKPSQNFNRNYPSKLASLSTLSKRTMSDNNNYAANYDRNSPNYDGSSSNYYSGQKQQLVNQKPLRRLPTIGGQCDYSNFHCRSDATCILNKYICDGRNDCRDGSDEEGCDDHEHLSVAAQLRKFPLHGNNYNDNYDSYYNQGSQNRVRDPYLRRPDNDLRAQEAARQHHIEQQRLLTQQRILEQNRGSKLIETGSSQRFPPNPPKEGIDLQVYDTPQTQFVGFDVVFRCRDEGSVRSPVKWYRKDGKPLPRSSSDIDGRLTMYSITENESGIYVCSSISSEYPVVEREATLTVSPRGLLDNLRSYSFCSTEFENQQKEK